VLPGAVIGWDLNAALALGGALDIPPVAMAELLPVIEAVMVRKLNAEMAANGGPGSAIRSPPTQDEDPQGCSVRSR
jgi:hypothetical protein